MKLAARLAELQSLDTRLDENHAAQAAMQAKLADVAAVSGAHAELTKSQDQEKELKAKLRALELETAGLTAKLKEINDRLYSGRITNAKELAGLNQDEKMLQKRKSELEDHELALMEQIEQTDAATRARREAYDQLSAQSDKSKSQERKMLENLQSAAAELEEKRAADVAQLPADALALYADLRRSKKGRAVAPVKGNSCGACGYQVPSGLLSRVAAGNEIVQCSNCGRILTP